MSIPRNYFLNVDPSCWLGVPFAFILLPMSGFCPSTLAYIFPSSVMAFILQNQLTFAFVFKLLIGIHSVELCYALYRCNRLGLTCTTTIKWLLNVSLHGVFALRMLHWPDRYYKDPKKNK